jgi:16S rRNA A1518/A1519 N6-dimethyltransferase RsmA/KsgA/DIM1 with predicted DNA glycosylase/AP lyase activity
LDKDQYFLVNEDKIDLMVSAAKITGPDTVAELGSGIGSVSIRIPKAKHIDLVENDHSLCSLLEARMGDRDDVTIHCTNAVRWLDDHRPDVIISNLPWNLTHDFLSHARANRMIIVVKHGEQVPGGVLIETLDEQDYKTVQPYKSDVYLVENNAIT